MRVENLHGAAIGRSARCVKRSVSCLSSGDEIMWERGRLRGYTVTQLRGPFGNTRETSHSSDVRYRDSSSIRRTCYIPSVQSLTQKARAIINSMRNVKTLGQCMVSRLDLDNIHPSPLPQLVRNRRILLPLIVGDGGGLHDQSRVRARRPALAQCAWVDHQHAFHNLLKVSPSVPK